MIAIDRIVNTIAWTKDKSHFTQAALEEFYITEMAVLDTLEPSQNSALTFIVLEGIEPVAELVGC